MFSGFSKCRSCDDAIERRASRCSNCKAKIHYGATLLGFVVYVAFIFGSVLAVTAVGYGIIKTYGGYVWIDVEAFVEWGNNGGTGKIIDVAMIIGGVLGLVLYVFHGHRSFANDVTLTKEMH